MPKSELVSIVHRYSVTLDDGRQFIVEHEWDENTGSEDWYAFDEDGNEIEDEKFVNELIGIVNS